MIPMALLAFNPVSDCVVCGHYTVRMYVFTVLITVATHSLTLNVTLCISATYMV